MIRMILGIVLTGAAFYVSVLYKSTSMVVLGYAGAVLLVMAGIFLVWRVRTVQGRLTIPISIAECGKPLTLRILLENRSFLPCLHFQCQVELASRFLRKKKKRWLQGGLAAAGENSYDYSLLLEDYGSYEVRLKKVRVYDLTGLFYIQKTVESSGCVQVLPKMQEIGVQLTEAVHSFFGDADVYDPYRPGDDHSELFQIRPFQNGDRLQRVHWKLSARLDELLVKEDSRPKACPVVFLLHYDSSRQRKMENVNAYLVILASISFSLMDSGCPHYVAWYGSRNGDLVRMRVDDEESLYLFLSCYLEETFEKHIPDLEQAYREKYRGENYLFLLQLDERLRLFKNGDKIAAFDTAAWLKELSRLNIIL